MDVRVYEKFVSIVVWDVITNNNQPHYITL